jgi:hypothetical protein
MNGKLQTLIMLNVTVAYQALAGIAGLSTVTTKFFHCISSNAPWKPESQLTYDISGAENTVPECTHVYSTLHK